VEAFPYGEAFNAELKKVDFQIGRTQAVTFGIATIYEAIK
jgi:hypothetical protein